MYASASSLTMVELVSLPESLQESSKETREIETGRSC